MNIVAVDIGGTHARFALAMIEGDRVAHLGEPVVMRAADHMGLTSAWKAFVAQCGSTPPRAAAIGVAGPVTGGPVHFVNSHWVVDPGALKAELDIDDFILLNDFGAMAHAAHALGPDGIEHLLGPDIPLPELGVISVIGPGTGLGVAALIRREHDIVVLETEGSHMNFAPHGPSERFVADLVAKQFGRASVERIISGPGLGEIVRANDPDDIREDAELWEVASLGLDAEAIEAMDIFLGAYGSAVGDLSLAHGAMGVVLTGGLTNRIRKPLLASHFHARFCYKGRYRARMESIPIKLITHPQPGLFGAAAAFAKEYAS